MVSERFVRRCFSLAALSIAFAGLGLAGCGAESAKPQFGCDARGQDGIRRCGSSTRSRQNRAAGHACTAPVTATPPAESSSASSAAADPLDWPMWRRAGTERHLARNGHHRPLGLWQTRTCSGRARTGHAFTPRSSCAASSTRWPVSEPGTTREGEKGHLRRRRDRQDSVGKQVQCLPVRRARHASRLEQLRGRPSYRPRLCHGRVRLFTMPRRRDRQNPLVALAERRVRPADHLRRTHQRANR